MEDVLTTRTPLLYAHRVQQREVGNHPVSGQRQRQQQRQRQRGGGHEGQGQNLSSARTESNKEK